MIYYFVLLALAVAGCVGTLVELWREGGSGATELPRSHFQAPEFRPPGQR